MVKKGEKGSIVTFRQILIKDKLTDEGELEKKRIPFLKYYIVFNLDQTSLQNITDGEITRIVTAEEIIENFSDRPDIELGDKPCYVPNIDTVRIPNQIDFDTPEDYYRVLFHELMHSTGHEKRLNRSSLT